MKAREGEAPIYKGRSSFSFRFEAQRPGVSFGRRLGVNLFPQSQSRLGDFRDIPAVASWKRERNRYLCIPFRQGAVEVKEGNKFSAACWESEKVCYLCSPPRRQSGEGLKRVPGKEKNFLPALGKGKVFRTFATRFGGSPGGG